MSGGFVFPTISKLEAARSAVADPPAERWKWNRGELIVFYNSTASEVVGRVDKTETAEGFGYLAQKFRDDPSPRVSSNRRRRFGSRISALHWLEEFARRLVREHDRALRPRNGA